MPGTKLAIAICLCLLIVAVTLWQPLATRGAVIAYDTHRDNAKITELKLLEIGEPVYPALIERTLSEKCKNRGRLVNFLLAMHPEVAYHAFAKAARESTDNKKAAAIEALGMLGRQEARPIIEQALLSDQVELQQAARQALEYLK